LWAEEKIRGICKGVATPSNQTAAAHSALDFSRVAKLMELSGAIFKNLMVTKYIFQHVSHGVPTMKNRLTYV